jgi:hypothetical protein
VDQANRGELGGQLAILLLVAGEALGGGGGCHLVSLFFVVSIHHITRQ